MKYSPSLGNKPLGKFITAGILVVCLTGGSQPGLICREQVLQNQIEKAKIFRDVYPLISDSDLYCSPFFWEGEMPVLRIIGAERLEEKTNFSDGDIIYLNMGKNGGLEPGQVYQAIEIGEKIKDYGRLAYKRGRVQVAFLEDTSSVARLEKVCGPLAPGDYLIPMVEMEGALGQDLGFEPYSGAGSGPVGNIIHLENDLNQIATGYWAVIDLGKNDGLQVGQQMIVFPKLKEGLPRRASANLIVISAQQKTATVKILSSNDAIRLGAQVQGR